MATDIDVRAIATFSSLPEATVTSAIDNPTSDLVRSLLKAIQVKAKDYEQSKSQKVKLEVELETHVRTTESKTKVLQNSRDKALADVSKLRVDLQNSENTRSKIESELEQVKQSASSEVSEVGNLKARIQSLEASSRDTIALLESKNSTIASLREEISSEHSKLVELRKQVSSLEQASQNAASTVASARFKEQSLQQELDLQKKNNDWLENERRIKTEEYTTFRKEKNARISELTRLNEQHIETVEELRRSESVLKSRLEEQISKHEELLQSIQKLREEKITDADNHRIELDSLTRLAQLQEASATTAKQRVEELQFALEETRDEAANEIGEIRAEIQAEVQDREAAEQRVTELEAKIAGLHSELDQARIRPSTPRQQETNGHGFSTPVRPATPSGIFSPGFAGRLKGSTGNLTVSQLYGEYKNLERELASEKRINAELQSNLDSMVEDLEAKKPEIDELREDQTRLQSEVFEMSTLVEKANHEREETIKHARLLQGQVEATTKELSECQQTLRDRNSQLRWLVMDREAREHGGSLSEMEFQELQQAAVEADARDTEHLSDTQRIVNQQLVLFKSVGELQQQNESQLVTIRNLVAQLEDTQSKQTQLQNYQIKKELEAARTKITDYQEEIKHMVSQTQSFKKERDMLKNMLSRRGQIDPKDFSRSMPLPAGDSPIPTSDLAASSTNATDYGKLLKDLQQHFDNYRHETSTDTNSLRNQINEATKRSSQLQTEASRVTGQLAAANQRYEMLQANYNALKVENSEITKRSYAAMENATKQELKTQQAAEELVEAKGLLDSLRRESANLKAEKDLWKSVEKRLIEDNESLRNERVRLDQLNGTMQNMLNERDHADADTRRRLQSEVDSLQNELTSAKRKLDEESEESRRISQRREFDLAQTQKRIDDLMTSLSTTREELSAAKTARDHLQARVDELTVELRSAEERVEVLTRPADVEDNGDGAGEEGLSREQELSVEVSELKRDLDLKTTELERANEQIEVYKNIAQSAEERLQELTDTNDLFKEETEAALADKDKKIADLEQRVEDISSELNTSNTELTSIRDEQSESSRKLDDQKSLFEAEITRLKEAEERSLEQAQFNLEASRAQAAIATEAQQNYENELVKHAEAAKNLHVVRAEANQLRLEMVDLRTQVGTAQNDLEQKEASWAEMKDRYERELTDLKKRRDDLAQQNSLLHGQLESLTQQVTALQRDRATAVESENNGKTEGDTKALGDLQEVIKYLRREKEIVDVQYHLSTQEAKRLRQQLDFTQSQLDDTRLKVDQQQRADADNERNAMSHKKLMDTLNELNLFRESSVTLRAEAKNATQALADKVKRVEQLEQEIQPLRARIAELENLGEHREGEMKLLQEDRDHWQQRCHNILSKYDRVDPAELESLRSKLAELESEKDAAVTAKSELQAQIDAHPAQVEAAKADLRNRLAEQFKGRSTQLSARIKDKQAELDAANVEKAQLQSELDAAREELNTAQSNGIGPQPEASTSIAAAQTDTGSDTRITDLQTRITQLEAQLVEKDQQMSSASSASDEKFKAREAQLKEVLNKRLAEVKQQANVAKDAALDELRQQLSAQHQQELEALRAQSVPVAAELQKPSDDVPSAEREAAADGTTNESLTPTFESFMSSITEAQARQLVQSNDTVRNILRANIRKSVEKEKEALRKELTENQQTSSSETATSSIEELEKRFETEKEAIIRQKEEELITAKEAMSKDFEERLESERQALITQKDAELASEKLYFSQESEKKIAEQVANAQALAEKRATVKLNMAQNKARVAQAKLDVVSQAADETPDKPVNEVWEVAKVAKPPPQEASQVKPTIPPPSSTVQAANAGTGDSTAAPAETNGVTEPASVTPKLESGATESSAASQPAPSGPPPSAVAQPRSQLPQVRGAFRGGRGGAANASQQGQTQAQPQTQANRGSGIPRGGGRGRGLPRGGAQTGVPTVSAGNRGGGSVAGSPGRGAPMNPAAQQFTPGGGNKRARDDGDSAQDGGVGKRIRGGGQGGA